MFFNEVITYLTNQKIEDERRLELFNALSLIFIEFPIDNEPPSSACVSLAANCGASLPSSLASGLNCITDQHIPIEQIADFISAVHLRKPSEIYSENKGKKIPGFGHPSIKKRDARVDYLLKNFDDLIGEHTNFCIQLETLMPVTMNIGCAIASLSLDSGISSKNCLFLPLMGRMFGWLKLYNKTQEKFNKVVPSFQNISNEHK